MNEAVFTDGIFIFTFESLVGTCGEEFEVKSHWCWSLVWNFDLLINFIFIIHNYNYEKIVNKEIQTTDKVCDWKKCWKIWYLTRKMKNISVFFLVFFLSGLNYIFTHTAKVCDFWFGKNHCFIDFHKLIKVSMLINSDISMPHQYKILSYLQDTERDDTASLCCWLLKKYFAENIFVTDGI